MANIIDKTYFFGNLSIAQLSEASVLGKLQWYIDQYESEFLEDLLGFGLYKSYLADATTLRMLDIVNGKEYTDYDGTNLKWKGLKQAVGTLKKSPIANYVYYKFTVSSYTVSTGSGEKKIEADNSIEMSPKHKLFTAWNEMVEMNISLIRFIERFPEVYPEYKYWECNKDNLISRANHIF